MESTLKPDVAELLSSLPIDIALHISPRIRLDPGILAVDYNLSRLRASGRLNAQHAELTQLPGFFAGIALELPEHEPTAQLRFELAESARRLSADGVVVLVEEHRQRAKRAARLVEEAFSSVTLQAARDGTLVIGRDPKPAEARPANSTIELCLPEGTHQLQVWPGLFSADEVDPGTALLIESFPEMVAKAVLDVGCGYGPLSIAAASRGSRVTFVDVDMRALRLTAANLERAGLEGTPVASEDLSELAANSFDVIVSNPPTHAGSDILRRLFLGMGRVARRQAPILLVLRAHLNYEKWLYEIGFVKRVRERDGYKVVLIEAKG